MGRVVSSEKFRDRKTRKSFRFWIRTSDHSKFPENKVEVINLTPYEIPKEVQEFLQHGRNAAIGGSKSEDQIFLELNDLLEKFQIRAMAENLTDMKIQEIKCHSFIAFQNIKTALRLILG